MLFCKTEIRIHFECAQQEVSTMAIVKSSSVHDVSLADSLGLLIDRDKGYMVQMDHWTPRAHHIKKHPFNLDLPTPGEWDSPQAGDIMFFQGIGSDAVVKAMVACINFGVVSGPQQFCYPRKMRVIYAQCTAERPNDHMVYFEICTISGVFICGDCSDCSGGGGHATSEMLGIFALLSTLYTVPIEKIEIPYETALTCSKNFEKEYEIQLL